MTFATIKQRYLALQRRWQDSLRRLKALATTIILLGVLLGEPLLCILHCQFWLPFAFEHHFLSSDHTHMEHMHMHGQPNASIAPIPETTQLPATHYICSFGTTTEAPLRIPPSPVHEMTPVLALILFICLQVHTHTLSEPFTQRRLLRAPPLPPPEPAFA